MAKIEVTNEQLKLIERALELYSRIGILQLEHILEHPGIDKLLTKKHTVDYDEPLDIGVETRRGEVVEIGEGYVKTKGSWGDGEEIKTWNDIDNIKRSPNYSNMHREEDVIKEMLDKIELRISSNDVIRGSSYGIFDKENVDESNRVAYDLVQVIRHEFWKSDENRSEVTVDSSVMLTTKNSDKIKVEL